MVRVAIVDDEQQWREMMCQYLTRYFNSLDEKCVCDTFIDGVDLVSDNKAVYDIVFLDIDMKIMDGVETAKKLRKIDENVTIVFITNLAQYAIKGYEVNAFDFIVKPLSYSAFFIKMKRIMKSVKRETDKRISLKYGENTAVISLKDIIFVEVLSHEVIFHTENGDYKVYGGLKDFEKNFDSKYFYRCHRSYLINLKYVTSVKGENVIVGGNVIPISRAKKKELLTLISKYIGGNL